MRKPLKVVQVSVHENALELQRQNRCHGGCGRVGNLNVRKTALAADVLRFAVADGSQIGFSNCPPSRAQSSLSLQPGKVRAILRTDLGVFMKIQTYRGNSRRANLSSSLKVFRNWKSF